MKLKGCSNNAPFFICILATGMTLQVTLEMKQAIVGFQLDELGDWVARLECGHNQHVRHDPPWQNREWVINPQTRQQHLGTILECKKCDENAPRDWN